MYKPGTVDSCENKPPINQEKHKLKDHKFYIQNDNYQVQK